ncbi:FAD-binding domain-containing protein [Flagelloscypha sp. PMI_526]|nr:FAD-binding domain-containing protein [Flagelloscypha sp. PMI_526]
MLVLPLTVVSIASVVAAQDTLSLPSSFNTEWKALASGLGGRLKRGVPIAAPCFSVVNGQPSTPDSAACSAVQNGYKSGAYRHEQAPAYMFVQWERCLRSEEKCLLDNVTPTNPAAYSNGTDCKQGSVPDYFFEVTGPQDVQLAFKFASLTKYPLSIKNSGHDFKGRSSQKGSLSLWTRHLNTLKYTPNFKPEGGSITHPRTITMGAGVSWDEAYKFADANNLTVVGGYHETVGASGGWMMGGGHSILSTVYGLGVDRVVQIKIVTPDGQYRTANRFQNKDLFWALRGGGGGTFGVVLESTILAEPRMKIQVASMSFTQTSTNYQGFLKIVVDNSLKWAKEGWGGHMGHTSILNVTPLLTLDQAKASVAEAVNYTLAQGGSATVEELPSWLAVYQKYVLAAQAPVGTEYTLQSRLMPAANFETEAGRATLLAALIKWVTDYNILPWAINATPFLFNSTEGPDATSVTPAWRKSIWHLTGRGLNWSWNSTADTIRSKYTLGTTTTKIMKDITPGSGAYFNEGDLYETDHEQSFWGDNYPRLLAIKKKYDPQGLLDCWQCVGWKGAANARFSCYLE